MEDKRINVAIFEKDNEDPFWSIVVTPEQMRLLKWLAEEQFLWNYRIVTNVEFKPI